MTTPLLGLPEIAEGVANQVTLHNVALRHIEAKTIRALSLIVAAPPAAVEGDSYIIPAGATGAWSGKTGQIAALIGGAWTYAAPMEGLRLWIVDLEAEYVYAGGAWVANGSGGGGSAPAQPFDLTAFYPGVPPASALVTRVPVARAVTFPSGLTGSIGKASAAATAPTVFSVRKNGASVGTITFAAGATSATFSAASAITLAVGDLVSIHAPSTADSTLADVGIVLAGTR